MVTIPEKPPENGTAAKLTIYRIIVWALAAVALVAVVGMIALSLWGVPIPEALISLGGVALGALVGIIARAPGSAEA